MSLDFMRYCTNNTFIMLKQYNNTCFEKYYYKHFTFASWNTVKQPKLQGNKHLDKCFANIIDTMLPNIITIPNTESAPSRLMRWFFPF